MPPFWLPAQCAGQTRKGTRCTMHAQSTMKDDAGRLAGEPLNHGCKFCRFHCELFLRLPVADGLTEKDTIFHIDFETSGLDVLRDFIVEVGLLRHCDGASFQTVVHPPELPSEGPTVHSVTPEELCAGPDFRESSRRMLYFIEGCTNMAPKQADDDSSADESADSGSLLADIPPGRSSSATTVSASTCPSS